MAKLLGETTALFSEDKETHLEEWGTCQPGYQLDTPTVIAGDNVIIIWQHTWKWTGNGLGFSVECQIDSHMVSPGLILNI